MIVGPRVDSVDYRDYTQGEVTLNALNKAYSLCVGVGGIGIRLCDLFEGLLASGVVGLQSCVPQSHQFTYVKVWEHIEQERDPEMWEEGLWQIQIT